MAVPMFVHGGDSAVVGGWMEKKKKEEEEEQRGEREERRKRSAVNNIQWHGTMAIPCGRLFRGRLNEAD